MVGGAAVAAAEWPSVSLFVVSRSVLGKRLRALATCHWRLSREHSPAGAADYRRGLQAARRPGDASILVQTPDWPGCSWRRPAGVTPPVSGSHSHWVSQSELAGRANGPAEGQKDTSQARLRLLTASMRTRVNMVPSTDPRDLRARSMEAFAGVGEVQWVRLPELCFYRKNQ